MLRSLPSSLEKTSSHVRYDEKHFSTPNTGSGYFLYSLHNQENDDTVCWGWEPNTVKQSRKQNTGHESYCVFITQLCTTENSLSDAIYIFFVSHFVLYFSIPFILS